MSWNDASDSRLERCDVTLYNKDIVTYLNNPTYLDDCHGLVVVGEHVRFKSAACLWVLHGILDTRDILDRSCEC